jgi:hypothetical protein
LPQEKLDESSEKGFILGKTPQAIAIVRGAAPDIRAIKQSRD